MILINNSRVVLKFLVGHDSKVVNCDRRMLCKGSFRQAVFDTSGCGRCVWCRKIENFLSLWKCNRLLQPHASNASNASMQLVWISFKIGHNGQFYKTYFPLRESFTWFCEILKVFGKILKLLWVAFTLARLTQYAGSFHNISGSFCSMKTSNLLRKMYIG